MMKKLSWFNKGIFCLTVFISIITLLGYLLPFLAPKLFPFLSVVTLVLPSLLIVNVALFCYWGMQFKRQVFLPLFVLLLGLTSFPKFYKFTEKVIEREEDDFVLMSYNVRLFNLFKWIPDEAVPEKIKEFVEMQDPDILCLQEFSKNARLSFPQFKYRYITTHGKKIKTGQAIYSKFQIIDKGEINLPNSNNNVVFVDILKEKDTIRVYSMHLQSVNISPDIHEKIDEVKSKKILNRLSKAFREQQLQSELIQAHSADAEYPVIICGDLNNSAFSYVYRNIKGELQDAFVEAGKGFGATYHFPYYPARIDYVFVDKRIEIRSFKTHSDFVNSDHYPITTSLKLKSND